jgi:hypothetical protein
MAVTALTCMQKVPGSNSADTPATLTERFSVVCLGLSLNVL